MYNLTDPDDLRKAIDGLPQIEASESIAWVPGWTKKISKLLEKVRAADLEERSSLEFHQGIWEDNPVSKPSQGAINIQKSLNNGDFRRWVAEQSLRLPNDKEEAKEYLKSFFSECRKRMKATSARTPVLKILRSMAVLFPRYFTTLASTNEADGFYRILFGEKPPKNAIEVQIRITGRIDEVMGDVDDSSDALAKRMTVARRLQLFIPPRRALVQNSPAAKYFVSASSKGKGFKMSEISFDMIFSQIKQYLAISEGVLQRLHLGLWANERRHFAVLAGLSGSGKTQLAIRYAEAVSGHFGHEPKRFVLPVQPGWHDPTPLFGYVNPLSDSKYERPAFLDFVLEAARTPEQPFFVILDEMNLSHPEHYFAPVLSAMETGDALTLHNEDDYFDGVPSKIPYPNNIAIIGTVNMDETTHGISDKVLDRAFTIEFWDIDLETYPRWGSRGLSQDAEGEAKKCLQGLINSLSPVRLHFGWRTVDEVLDYLQAAEKSGMHMETSKFLDQVVHSKVLPKLRGTESYRLQAALENTKNVLGELGLSESENKLAQLTDDLKETGLMRFWR